mmetsp:Transcript_29255/g.38464  ORF Transcript_29255/g.38464 Transcript_29255/m.38464 type:complete len:378 (+) Transcript_29255:65-1198(+)|eukprot:CAMPEP_0117761940 /NCGR_PEP_ID=MMETSP0947-20121206/17590_1 /TAXON_ID=44440 /ORGANISM="Chattonella subsalsa, Strain CCMP2191" /LENGTH=377 /DNA_ID=CAMNT_0005583049 /DNA_START=59 /DNA_END=1192 /DNA_ORIENTATION=+
MADANETANDPSKRKEIDAEKKDNEQPLKKYLSSATQASKVVEDCQEKTKGYLDTIDRARSNHCLVATEIPGDILPEFEEKYVGKVRDVYKCKNYQILVSTDRQSAFDRNLASIPFKGQVLNLTSQWWFDQTKALVPNHVICSPDPNVTVGKKCTVFPIEFVMRGYITGTTGTSMWMNYKKGVRQYCGHSLPEGLVKNQKLESNLLTPTTKDSEHDELISAEEIVSSGRMSQEEWDKCAAYAQELFAFGQGQAAERGLILVDTKYEFGKDAEGNVLLIDEIHTPDSSRYWVAASYEQRMAEGKEPENIDKEFLRLWFRNNCDPYNDPELPEAPAELVCELSRRYIMLYELITGETFQFPDLETPVGERIKNNLKEGL